MVDDRPAPRHSRELHDGPLDPERPSDEAGRRGRGAFLAVLGLAAGAGAFVHLLSDRESEPGLEGSRVAEFQDEGGGVSGAIWRAPPDPEPAPAPPVAPAMPENGEIETLRTEIEALRRAVEAGRNDGAVAAAMDAARAEIARLAAGLEARAQRIEERLDHRLARLDARTEARSASFTPTAAPVDEAAREAARQRAEREAEARRLHEAQIASEGVVFEAQSALATPAAEDAAERGDRGFLRRARAEATETALAAPLPYPDRTIVEGTFIRAVLETAINSDLPGAIRAVVAADVRAFDGRAVIFPRGTRLIGTYNSDLDIAQDRTFVVWTRAVTPDGASVALGSTGADRLGRAGVTGFVDTHFTERFGSAALISIIGAAPAVATAEAGADRTTAEIAAEIGDDFRSSVSAVLARYLSIPPTIHVDQGDVVTVIAGRDLVVFAAP